MFREINSRRSSSQTMIFQERKEQKFQKLIFCKAKKLNVLPLL